MHLPFNDPFAASPSWQPALDALAKAYGTTTFTIEPGVYKSVKAPIKTIGDYNCLVVRKDLPDALVYELNKAMWANKASIVAAVKDFNELSIQEALPVDLPAHPGSVQFWKSVK